MSNSEANPTPWLRVAVHARKGTTLNETHLCLRLSRDESFIQSILDDYDGADEKVWLVKINLSITNLKNHMNSPRNLQLSGPNVWDDAVVYRKSNHGEHSFTK